MHSHQHGINIEALLAHVPVFSGLETEEIARLARGSRELTASRGDILFHKGDMPTGFYLIVYGQVKLAFTSAQGGEKVVDILGQGQTFGEAVMFMDKPCMVYAQALADSLLLHIAKAAVVDELNADPRLGRKMIAGLSMRLHHLISDVESYSLCSGRQRIIGYLLREIPTDCEKSITVTLPTSKGIIASRLNLTQEHFSRILHELSEKGLVVVEGRKIHIPDVGKLRTYDQSTMRHLYQPRGDTKNGTGNRDQAEPAGECRAPGARTPAAGRQQADPTEADQYLL